MSPRAAWRLETLGFEHVHDYVEGKADWLARALPREGSNAAVPSAGDMVDAAAPTCGLSDDVASARAIVEASRYGYCLVVNEERIVLGRLRRGALEDAADDNTVDDLIEAGPSTVRPSTPARQLVERLRNADVRTAIVTDPDGRLLGLFSRADAERRVGAT